MFLTNLRYFRFIFFAAFFSAIFYTNCFAILGDVDNSGDIGLNDVIIAMQICAGMPVSNLNLYADVNDDGYLGIEEAVYAARYIGLDFQDRLMQDQLAGMQQNIRTAMNMITTETTETTEKTQRATEIHAPRHCHLSSFPCSAWECRCSALRGSRGAWERGQTTGIAYKHPLCLSGQFFPESNT